MKGNIVVQGDGIHKLIPQRPPIVMVDKFYGIIEKSSYSGLTVTDENIFCQDGRLQEPGIIEHIAQSAAARIGYIYTENNEPVPLGFIGSVDKLTINKLPEVGTVLETEITVIQEVADITLIAAIVKEAESEIASCRMKIFLKKDGKEEK